MSRITAAGFPSRRTTSGLRGLLCLLFDFVLFFKANRLPLPILAYPMLTRLGGREIGEAFGVKPARVSNVVTEIESGKAAALARRVARLRPGPRTGGEARPLPTAPETCQIAGAVNDRKDRDLVLPRQINQPIALDEDLPYRRLPNFRNDPAALREGSQGASRHAQLLNERRSLEGRISRNELGNLVEIVQGSFSPPQGASHFENRASACSSPTV